MANLIKYFLPFIFLSALIQPAKSELLPAFTNTYIHKEKPNSPSDSLSFREKIENCLEWCDDHALFNRVYASATLGTTGIGLELSTPITKWTRLRAGVSWMPSFRVPMEFDINTFTDGLPSNNFQHVQELLYDMTGIEMDEKVNMTASPYMLNFKLLLDVYPFQNNRHWHFTAGFYAGNSTIAKAKNTPEEKPTLVGLNVYNRAYNYFTEIEDIYDVPIGGGVYMDPQEVLRMQERFRRYGHMGIHVGDFKDGTPYIMEPAPDGSLSAKAYVHKFKPYLGFGYAGNLDRKGKWTIGVEAGALFWGGYPDVFDQNGVNMTKDLVNVKGKVGEYLRLIKALPVFPVVELRISYNIY